VGELAVIGNSEARALDHLSRELDCHIAAYRREARGEAEGLCRNYQAAELDGRQLRRLHSLSLVAFAKPLSRHWD